MEKQFTRSYGLNEIALVPSNITIDPELVDISTKIANLRKGIFPSISIVPNDESSRQEDYSTFK